MNVMNRRLRSAHNLEIIAGGEAINSPLRGGRSRCRAGAKAPPACPRVTTQPQPAVHGSRSAVFGCSRMTHYAVLGLVRSPMRAHRMDAACHPRGRRPAAVQRGEDYFYSSEAQNAQISYRIKIKLMTYFRSV